MGSGPGVACAITLNSALTPEQQKLYQDPLVIQRLLRETRTIAIVGLSTDPQRASWFVASYLKKEGYRIIPVNPRADFILGEKSYPDLASIPARRGGGRGSHETRSVVVLVGLVGELGSTLPPLRGSVLDPTDR